MSIFSNKNEISNQVDLWKDWPVKIDEYKMGAIRWKSEIGIPIPTAEVFPRIKKGYDTILFNNLDASIFLDAIYKESDRSTVEIPSYKLDILFSFILPLPDSDIIAIRYAPNLFTPFADTAIEMAEYYFKYLKEHYIEEFRHYYAGIGNNKLKPGMEDILEESIWEHKLYIKKNCEHIQ